MRKPKIPANAYHTDGWFSGERSFTNLKPIRNPGHRAKATSRKPLPKAAIRAIGLKGSPEDGAKHNRKKQSGCEILE